MIWKRILKRLWFSFVVFVGVSVLIFSLARVIPGDPARLALGSEASQEQVDQLRELLHLNDPLPVQYFYFVQGIFKGDLGLSLYTKRPVQYDLFQFLPATLELVAVAGLLMALIGIPLGTFAARFRNGFMDHFSRLLALLSVAAPSFLWAAVLMLIFSYQLEWFPIMSRISEENESAVQGIGFILFHSLFTGNFSIFWDALQHITLPALALSLSGLGQASRLTRSNVVSVLEMPHIEMARSYNFPSHKLMFKYALRPAMIPTLTILGLDLAAMLGNAFLVEAIFAWPGLAKYGVEVILHKDLNAIVGTVLVMSLFFLIINIVVDVLVSLINPKIRFKEA